MAAQIVPSPTRWFTPDALAVGAWGVRDARERVARGDPRHWAGARRAFEGLEFRVGSAAGADLVGEALGRSCQAYDVQGVIDWRDDKLHNTTVMDVVQPRLTYVGGPTALLEWRGLRLLTDPTFDPAGTTYELPAYTLRKTQPPAVEEGQLGRIDAVLLSHDHHFDNLDRAGRAMLSRSERVLTTVEGAGRLDARAVGLSPWERVELQAPDGRSLAVTATPARHGPADSDRGPVIGFALAFADQPEQVIYVSGDTVWYDGVGEVIARFRVRTALLNLGAAKVRPAGDRPLTFTAIEAVKVARAAPSALIVPLHFEGWEHFTESRADVEREFGSAGLVSRLRWLVPGRAIGLAGLEEKP